MVWLIIIGVLALAIGPIFYMLPSAQDRYLAGLRQQARNLGFSMQLRRLPTLNPTAEERVSASGRQRNPVVDCMCYEWMVRQPLQNAPDLLLQRIPNDPTVPVQELASGWGFAKLGERSALDQAGLVTLSAQQSLQNNFFVCVEKLPSSVIAVGLNAAAVSFYWKESAAADRQVEAAERLQVAQTQLESRRDQAMAICTDLVKTFGSRAGSTAD